MAYVDGFEYDIFISYAHLDNETAFEDEPGWVELFYKDLDLSLGQRYGRANAVKIWWDDRRLEGNTFFDQSIQESIEKSAIMLCLMSPGYLESEYCKKEMKLFHAKAQQEPPGLKVGHRSRLLNVLLYNIPYNRWPLELSGTSGFPFYNAENDDLGDRLDTGDTQFRKQLQELKKSIVTLFELMKKPLPPPPPPPAFSIFFGDVPDSLRSVKRRTITELEKRGYAVIGEVPPPFEKEEHEKTVKEKIEESFLNVHLLDQFPGREIEGEETIWYPQKQVEIGLLSKKPQLIWVPEGTDLEIIEEEPYKTFVQGLEGGKRSSKKIDFIRGAKSELTQQIIDLVEQLKKEQEQLKKTDPDAARTAVLLDTHLSDQLYAWKVGESLLENGIQAYLNPVEDDPGRNVHILEDRIGQVSKLIFFYGKVSWDWVRGRMNAALQSIVTNYYPVEEFIVFMVPPHKDPADIALRQWVLKVAVVNNSDTPQLDTASLQPLIQSIKKPLHER